MMSSHTLGVRENKVGSCLLQQECWFQVSGQLKFQEVSAAESPVGSAQDSAHLLEHAWQCADGTFLSESVTCSQDVAEA